MTDQVKIAKTPQGQIIAGSPRVSVYPASYGFWKGQEWLGNPRLRYGSLVPSRHVSFQVKVEMLRDPVIAMASGFTGAMLVKCRRVVRCSDEKIRDFFQAMIAPWEREFVLMANTAVALGSCGLIKQLAFEVPRPVAEDASPVWSGRVDPLIVSGFQQIHPMLCSPRFDEKGLRFEGIEGPDGPIDPLYSLWITLGKARAFGSYWGSGRLENVYQDWWMKQFSRDLYMVSLQKEADRVVQVRYPPGQTESGEQNRDIALAIGDSVRAGATVAIPSNVYQSFNSVSGDESLSSVSRWAIEFMEGSASFSRFHEIDDHHDRKMALGWLLPPQAVLDVTGGDLGGPTSADKLTTLAMEVLMLDAAEIDRHLNEYVFPIVQRANFPAGSPPVFVETVGLDSANQEYLFQVVKGLLSDPSSDSGRLFDLPVAMDQLKFPKRDEKEVQAEIEKEKKEAEAAAQKPTAPALPDDAAPPDGDDGEAPADKGKGDGAQAQAPTEAIAGAALTEDEAEKLRRRIGGELPPIETPVLTEGDALAAWKRLVESVPELASLGFDYQLDSADPFELGGPGSGNWGHAGRPGIRGGSVPKSSAMSIATGRDAADRQAARKSGKGGGDSVSVAMTGYELDFSTLKHEESEYHRAGFTMLPGDGTAALFGFPGQDKTLEGLDETFLDETRIEYKVGLCGELEARTGLDEESVAAFVAQWAISSNDTSMQSLAIQAAAAEEFGIELSDYQREKIAALEPVRDRLEEAQEFGREIFVRALDENGVITEDDVGMFKDVVCGGLHEYADGNIPDYEIQEGLRSIADYMYDLSEGLIGKSGSEAMRIIDQKITRRASGFYPIPLVEGDFATGADYIKANMTAARKMLRAMHDISQERFASLGIKEVIVCRGVCMPDGVLKPGMISHRGNAMESWTTNLKIAEFFGNYSDTGESFILVSRVPVSRVLSTAATGFGCLSEFEYVLLGGQGDQSRCYALEYDEIEGHKLNALDLSSVALSSKADSPPVDLADAVNDDWLKKADPEQAEKEREIFNKFRNEGGGGDGLDGSDPFELGGPGSGNWGHAGRPGVVGGSAPKGGAGAGVDKYGIDEARRAWVKSLTEPERYALRLWGESGFGIRKLQTGETERVTARDLQRSQYALPHWESALARGVEYEGTVYRGLSDVPEDVVNGWIRDGGIEFNCDQSSSKDESTASSFVGNVMLIVNQRSGIDLCGETNVTSGGAGHYISEQEVILRKGARYAVKSFRYVKKNGDVFDSDWYFEDTEYSWPGNPPEGWSLQRDVSGHYELFLEEV